MVNNVLTLAAVPHIMTEGGASLYAQLGIERSKGTMPIQLAGNIRQGGLFETAFGITLGELVNEIGGGTASGLPVKAVQVGGPLGAYIHPSQFGLPFGLSKHAVELENFFSDPARLELHQFQILITCFAVLAGL